MFNFVRNFIIKKSDNSIIFNIVSRAFDKPQIPPKLGRWGLIHDQRVDRKVDWSNEDHCGPCGSLKLDKYTKKK